MIIDYPWYYVLLCLLVGAAYAVVLYFVGRRTFGKVTNVTLAVLRFVAVTVIALLLLSPVAKRTVHERQQPHVDLIEDRSLSVQMSADSAFALANLYEDIANHCRTTLSSDTSNVGRTDLGGMLDKINPDAAAVVLSSDGINNHGQNPVTVAEQLGMPVYTIALGDTTPRRDAALANLRHNRIAYLAIASLWKLPLAPTACVAEVRDSLWLTASDTMWRLSGWSIPMTISPLHCRSISKPR